MQAIARYFSWRKLNSARPRYMREAPIANMIYLCKWHKTICLRESICSAHAQGFETSRQATSDTANLNIEERNIPC
jgi:hypothetical protein